MVDADAINGGCRCRRCLLKVLVLVLLLFVLTLVLACGLRALVPVNMGLGLVRMGELSRLVSGELILRAPSASSLIDGDEYIEPGRAGIVFIGASTGINVCGRSVWRE